MAAAAASRLGLPVYKTSPPALQRQRACPVGRLAHPAGARRVLVCEAAYPQSSSTGSQTAGSESSSVDEVDIVLHTGSQTAGSESSSVDEVDIVLQKILTKLEEHDKKLDSLKEERKEILKKVKNVHEAMKAEQTRQAARAKTLRALIESDANMERVLTEERPVLRRGVQKSTGRTRRSGA